MPMADNVELIKEKINLVDYVERYVKLRKRGKNFSGLCPFHKESTPSFSVSPERQVWHCFGCGRGGDVFTFVMEKEGLDFRQSLEYLAKQAGIRLRFDKRRSEEDQRLFDVLEQTTRFFQDNLNNQKIGVKAMSYFTQERRINPELIQKFRLGYAPNSWEQTGKHLLDLGFSEKELESVGLIIRKDPVEGESGWYDRFRNRIVFPIKDRIGRIVGFSARTLDPDPKSAKYVNSPETKIFNKGCLLYGLSLAQETIRKLNYTILVEGHLDVISLHGIGVINVVATQGTALTQSQVELVKRLTNRIIVFFDSDEAGINATLKAIQSALVNNMEVKITTASFGKDADESIRNNPEQTIKDLKNSIDFYQFLLNTARDKINPHDYNVPVQIADFILPSVKIIKNQVKQEALLQKLAGDLNISVNALTREIQKLAEPTDLLSSNQGKAKAILTTKSKITRFEALWQSAGAMLLQIPSSLSKDARLIEVVKDLPEPEPSIPTTTLCMKMIQLLEEKGEITSPTLNSLLTPPELKLADLLALSKLGTITKDQESFLKNLGQIIRDIKIIHTKSQIAKTGRWEDDNQKRTTKLRKLIQELKELQLPPHGQI